MAEPGMPTNNYDDDRIGLSLLTWGLACVAEETRPAPPRELRLRNTVSVVLDIVIEMKEETTHGDI